MVRFVQLSDPHLTADGEAVKKGVVPNARFAAAVAEVAAMDPLPDFCLITGDLVADETDGACYRRLVELCAPLPRPVHFCLGNHDDRDLFRAVVHPKEGPADGRYQYSFDAGDARFFVLDSLVPGDVGGRLGAEQLTWLEEELGRARSEGRRRALVAVHHPPATVGVPWMDRMGLHDGEALISLLGRSPIPVERVLYGHLHMVSTQVVSGVALSSAPSTAYQFTDPRGDNAHQGGEVVPGTGGYVVGTLGPRGLSTVAMQVEAD